MSEMLTLGKAAKLAGVSRTALTQAIRDGRLAAMREADWVYRIDPRDLGRAFAIPGLMAESSIDHVPQNVADAAPAREEQLAAAVYPVVEAMPQEPIQAPSPAREELRATAVHPVVEAMPPKPILAPSPAQPSLVQRLFTLVGIGRSARA